MTTFQRETDQPVIGFDMGGTDINKRYFKQRNINISQPY